MVSGRRNKLFNERPFDFKRKTLDNGFEIISVKKDTNIVSINMGIKVGALYEDNNEKGISHFVEHMIFKGTETKNYEEVNQCLEYLGGDYNAYTDYMYTVFSSVCLSDELKPAIEILKDMICNSTFPPEEIEKERGVILSELKSSKDDLEDFSIRKVNEYAFEKSGLRYDVLGLEKNIKNYKREELYNYYKKYYVPENAVMVVVSPYEHEEVIELLKCQFENWEKGKINKPSIIVENNRPKYKESYKKDIEQSTIVFLYTFHDLDDEEELALRVLSNRLGESSNSILFKELREKRGLAYDVYTSIDCGDNIKTMYIYTATDDENVEEVVDCIKECINHVKDRNFIFDCKTFELMKKIFMTSLVSTMEDTTELSGYILSQAMEKRHIFEFKKEMEWLHSMKSEQIYKVAGKVLQSPTIHVTRINGES